jgi:hypothetical protein
MIKKQQQCVQDDVAALEAQLEELKQAIVLTVAGQGHTRLARGSPKCTNCCKSTTARLNL